MGQSQKHPLRALSEQEERELQRIVKAESRAAGCDSASQSAGGSRGRTAFYGGGPRSRIEERRWSGRAGEALQ